MKVVIIGTGNVANSLGRKIKDSSHLLVQVAGRNAMHAAKMGMTLDVPHSGDFNLLNKGADLYIVAIADDALKSIGDWLQLDRKLVVHTAGSVSKHALKSVSKNYGVLYPLQSLTAEMNIIAEIPFLVDGNTPDDLALIKDFANDLSEKVHQATDEARLNLHVAAVLVNNFSNHLYALAEKLCIQERLPFDLLHPLISETANRLSHISPKDAQTGPAMRGDVSTISKQMELLEAHPELKRIYEQMTESIRKFYGTSNP